LVDDVDVMVASHADSDHIGLEEYSFRFWPNAVINFVADSRGERYLNLFYLVDFYASYDYYEYSHWMLSVAETLL
jgi:hypothetical protein